jgi:hypothetical protein
MGLFSDYRIRVVKTAAAEGTDAVVSDAVDATGYKSVTFLAIVGTPAADNILSVESSSDASSWAAVSGSAVTPGAEDAFQWVEVYRPTKKYLRATVARDTATTVDTIIAIQGDARLGSQDNTEAGEAAGVFKVMG